MDPEAESHETPPQPVAKPAVDGDAKRVPVASPDPAPPTVWESLLYGLSLPERAVRSTTGVVGGAVRESATLLVPTAFQDSRTYTTLVRNTLDFLVEEIGLVETSPTDAAKPAEQQNQLARLAVSNFVEMAGVATLHVSPLTLLAIVSDVAYGSKTYLHELADELKREGIIAPDSTIDRAADLLEAVRATSSSAADMFDTPPLSLEGLQQSIEQTRAAAANLDPTDVLPRQEIDRLWSEMRAVAEEEEVSLFEVSSAVTLRSLDRVADVGRGTLSTVRVAGTLLDRHLLEHYRRSLGEIHERGYYETLAEVSGPYIEALWRNFSPDRLTITEDLFSGRLIGRAATRLAGWFGRAP